MSNKEIVSFGSVAKSDSGVFLFEDSISLRGCFMTL